MSKKDLMSLDTRVFGLPLSRKFPMQDEKHLKAAISYFYTAKEKDRPELARNIIRRHKELKSNIKVSKKNPLYAYVPTSMQLLKEAAEPIVTQKVIDMISPVFMLESDKTLLEMLINNANITNIEDLDNAVDTNYPNRENLLAAMKSAIMFDEYPANYIEFPVLTNKHSLDGNNGGLKLVESVVYLMKYDNSKNERAPINQISETNHVKFAALLREWADGYYKGNRNRLNDILMIETWVSQVKSICEADSLEHNDSNYQKLLDLGIDTTDVDTINAIVDNINNQLEIIDIPMTVAAGGNNNINIKTTIGRDGTMYASTTKGANDDYEKYK